MSEPKLIGRPARDTPTESEHTPGRRRRLPDDLLRQAARRLETMALIGAVLWLLATLLGHLAFHITNPGDPRWAQLQTSDGVAAASTAVSLAPFFYLRTDSRDPARVVDVGLVYMVIMAFAIGVVIWLIGRNVAALAHKLADPNSRLCCLEAVSTLNTGAR